MRRRLKVTPIEGELFRYLVESQRENEGVPEYLVDLSANGGLGCCSCQHYEHRIYDLIKPQLHLPWDKMTPICCVHLIDAREYFLQTMIHVLTEHIKKQSEVKRVFGTGNPPEPKKPDASAGFFQKFFHWKEKN